MNKVRFLLPSEACCPAVRSSVVAVAVAVTLVALGASSLSAAEPTLAFNRDVRPVLADNCFACHGPDANKRKAKLRLDTREGLFESTPKRGPAVIPGRIDQGELWARIVTTNSDDKMPPEDSHKELKPEQVATLKNWILGGAPWQGHWSFVKPEKAAVPEKFRVSSSKFRVRNPIDAFILAALERKGLSPNKEADRRTLARRVSLDLTGLPPKPEVVEAFLGDKSADAYEKLVKQLMASPRYGEHRARYWLDAARYADTHGLHFDNYREMWPYRDWVIKAFNSNMPFDRFTLLQIAGDLLTEEEIDALIATGFHRCNMTTNEGGTIDDENLANYANDRVTTTAWVWLGMTMNCAACHDHKFDPLTTKDFYSMAAFFRNTMQGPKDGNSKESNPSILVPQTPEDAARLKALPKEIAGAKAGVDQRRKEARTDFDGWVKTAKAEEFAKDVPTNKLLVHLPLNEGASNVVKGFAGQPGTFTASGALDWKEGGRYGAAPKLKKDANFDLGDVANFDRTNQFSYGCWARITAPGPFGTLISRMDQGKDFQGWDLAQIEKKIAVHFVSKWPGDGLKVVTRNDVVKAGEWQHFFATHDGSGKAKGVKLYVDGVEVPVKLEKDELKSSTLTAVPARLGQRSKDQFLEDGRLQDVRIYGRALSAKEVLGLAKVAPLQYVLGIPAGQRTKEQTSALFDQWLTTRDTGFISRTKLLADLNSEQDTIKARNPVTHVQREKTNSMAMAQILFRGAYDKPRDEVSADTPAAMHRMPTNAPRNRLGLAQWINSPENPLTARVIVNRLWQEVFGVGLVKSAEDFGLMGENPSHPELLDWLAVEFRESGWDVKHMIELMVTSSAYRQGAEIASEKLEKDPQNRLLSRAPRFRMDAEMVRDTALAASGLLVDKIGGAPVKPYQPDGLWEVVGMPESNTRKYKRDTGEALYRRSMYTFWKRASPPATMDIFNAPSREVCAVRRERTNTPLQALATLNDPQFIEAARHLAQLALAGGRKEEESIQFMAERVLSRSLSGKELGIVKGTLREALNYYNSDHSASTNLLSVGDARLPEKASVPQLAAMTMVANQLMNLDETLNK